MPKHVLAPPRGMTDHISIQFWVWLLRDRTTTVEAALVVLVVVTIDQVVDHLPREGLAGLVVGDHHAVLAEQSADLDVVVVDQLQELGEHVDAGLALELRVVVAERLGLRGLRHRVPGLVPVLEVPGGAIDQTLLVVGVALARVAGEVELGTELVEELGDRVRGRGPRAVLDLGELGLGAVQLLLGAVVGDQASRDLLHQRVERGVELVLLPPERLLRLQNPPTTGEFDELVVGTVGAGVDAQRRSHVAHVVEQVEVDLERVFQVLHQRRRLESVVVAGQCEDPLAELHCDDLVGRHGGGASGQTLRRGAQGRDRLLSDRLLDRRAVLALEDLEQRGETVRLDEEREARHQVVGLLGVASGEVRELLHQEVHDLAGLLLGAPLRLRLVLGGQAVEVEAAEVDVRHVVLPVCRCGLSGPHGLCGSGRWHIARSSNVRRGR